MSRTTPATETLPPTVEQAIEQAAAPPRQWVYLEDAKARAATAYEYDPT